ncbi:MAG: hypothetical protein J6M57_09440, partial [Acidaminococcaceae bacterium]|nr:hypothetical protein [Acidaminococcaceae bacterium]
GCAPRITTAFQPGVWSFFRPKASLELGNCKLPQTDIMYTYKGPGRQASRLRQQALQDLEAAVDAAIRTLSDADSCEKL